MALEEKLSGWTGPSSPTEKDKQDRTVRMVKEAIAGWDAFSDCSLTVYPKGSYANNTNVRADSDVDVAVECHECTYWEEQSPGVHKPGAKYSGIWTPEKLRSELVAAVRKKFPGQVDTSGSTAIQVNSSSARVDADVVPCFSYRYYFNSGGVRRGTKIFPKTGTSFKNYPEQQLENGRAKNARTHTSFKKAVRIMKRVENAMVVAGKHREVPSYFVECLVYNCSDAVLNRSTWVGTTKGVLGHIWSELQGSEPSDSSKRWHEVNGIKWLFHSSQNWTRQDGRDFAKAAWNYLELGR